MTATKANAKNCITEEKYLKIKSELNSPKDDCRIMKKYGIGATTTRRIRNTKNYYEYRATSTTGRKERKRLEASLADLLEQEESNYLEFKDEPVDCVVAFIITMLVLFLLVVGCIITLIVGSK